MKKASSLLTDEGGSLIVFTLMVLALLTIVGLAAIRTADTEIEIAGTELQYQNNFYLAEGAAMEAVRWLDNNTIDPLNGPSWMDMTGVGDWGLSQTCTLDANAEFIATYDGLAEGSSLDVNKTKLHDITIYGRSQKSGVAEIRLGYRKAF